MNIGTKTPDQTASLYARAVRWAWIVAVVVICIRVGISPHRQSSYAKDYVPAGWHWLHGTNVYDHHQRHFVYSPPVAAFFAPFSALGDSIGGIVWRVCCAWLLVAAATAWLHRRLRQRNGTGPPQAGSHAMPTALLLLLPLAIGNLNLGQMNVLVLVLVVGGVLAVERESWNLAAGLLAAAAFVKIYPLALGLLLAVLYPRQLSWRLALALPVLFILSFGLQRPGYVWAEYRQWFAVLGHDDRLDVDLYATWRDFGYLLKACGVPLTNQVYRLMEVASGSALALFFWLGQRRYHWRREILLSGVLCLGCAWMMLFGPATEAATYVVLALPVCGTLVAAWTIRSGPERETSSVIQRWILTTVYVLLFLANVTNGWFHGLTHHLYMRALQPVAALLFAGGIIWSLLHDHPLPVTSADAMLAHGDTHGENGGGHRRIDGPA